MYHEIPPRLSFNKGNCKNGSSLARKSTTGQIHRTPIFLQTGEKQMVHLFLKKTFVTPQLKRMVDNVVLITPIFSSDTPGGRI